MGDYNNENIFSKRLRAGKRRTYFFDVRTTKNNDYFITLTESKKKYDGEGYDRHKIFLYKEDFNKFIDALNETINHVKTELMPDFDFDAFNHDEDYNSPTKNEQLPTPATAIEVAPPKDIENEMPADIVAEELTTTAAQQDASYTKTEETENPSANDDAETW